MRPSKTLSDDIESESASRSEIARDCVAATRTQGSYMVIGAWMIKTHD